MLTLNDYSGILFIGDPHLWSKSPGKRLDPSFTLTVLNKIEQAIIIANEQNLYPFFLGDLFHDDDDNDTLMLVLLTKILKKAKFPPATLVGNHEKTQTTLTDDTPLALLREAGVIHTVEKNEIFAKFTINGQAFYLGGTPYGQKIPTDVASLLDKKESKNKDSIIWTTHADFAFGKTYPGSIPLPEIKNCFMSINGHIHDTKKSIAVGKTKWWNPGNITRMSIDQKDHIPQVWKWTPELGNELLPIPLVYEKNIFNLLGTQIEATEKAPQEFEPIKISSFVNLLKQNELPTQKTTDDGAYIKDSILALAHATNLEADLLSEILNIAEDSIKQ